MKTREEAANSIYKYIKYVINEENVMSAVLKANLVIEYEVESLLQTILKNASVLKLDRMFFPQKIDLLVALGTISVDDATPYKKLNEIRRKYAHDLDYELKHEDVQKLEDSLSQKHLAISEIQFKDIMEVERKIKMLTLPLFSLLIFQNSVDELNYKSPIEPMTLEELKYYSLGGLEEKAE